MRRHEAPLTPGEALGLAESGRHRGVSRQDEKDLEVPVQPGNMKSGFKDADVSGVVSGGSSG